FVRAATRITHTDPRAEEGALAVALAAAYGTTNALATIRRKVAGGELLRALDAVESHLERGAEARELAESMGLARGITGYVNHTVPVALYCWLRYAGDYRRTVEEAIALGGDSDTTGAIAGAMAGATLGTAAIPGDLLDGLAAWPRTA